MALRHDHLYVTEVVVLRLGRLGGFWQVVLLGGLGARCGLGSAVAFAASGCPYLLSPFC